jgi:hypothetical protein
MRIRDRRALGPARPLAGGTPSTNKLPPCRLIVSAIVSLPVETPTFQPLEGADAHTEDPSRLSLVSVGPGQDLTDVPLLDLG